MEPPDIGMSVQLIAKSLIALVKVEKDQIGARDMIVLD